MPRCSHGAFFLKIFIIEPDMQKNLIVILGPTASGKTALAVQLANELGGEILSADSRQVYRGMDIGTGKDLAEFQIGGKIIPHHLIDMMDPRQEFSVYDFQKHFYEVFRNLRARQVLPVLVGGTGLYLESVLMNYDMPEAAGNSRLREELAEKSMSELRNIVLAMKRDLHNKTDLDDKERLIRKIEIEQARRNQPALSADRPAVHAAVFGIHWERSELRKRISLRLQSRLEVGMIAEVERLHAEGVSWERLDRFGLEYRYIARYLQNLMSEDEMKSRLQIAIGQFAKRQMTWFRRMEKRGIRIEWLPGNDYSELHRRVLACLS